MTIDALFLLKALFSISIVVGLSLIAERAGPRVAGLLTGLPLGAGIVIIFTGIEQGAVFSTQAAQHMVPGFVTTVVFVYLYATVAARLGQGGFAAVFPPLLAANIGYAGAAFLVSQIKLPMWVAIVMVAMVMVIGSKLMTGLPNTPIMARVRFGWRVMAFRAGMATAAILLITGIASNIGAQWTGILTAYPLTLLPLILVLHITYTGSEIAAVLKHVPMGLGGVVSFCVTASYSLPAFGLGWGVILSYVAAFSYLLAYSSLSSWWRGRRPV